MHKLVWICAQIIKVCGKKSLVRVRFGQGFFVLKITLLCAKFVLVFGAYFLCDDFEARHYGLFFLMGLGFLRQIPSAMSFHQVFLAPKLRCLGLGFFALILVWISQVKSFIHC